MRLKFSEFLALVSFVGWFINFMKFKKQWAKWLFGLVCLGSICYVIFSNEKESREIPQSVSTSGNNSPAIIQSATTAGSNSPVIQAAAGSTVNTIINNGISAEQMRELLKERFDTPNQEVEFAKQFPQGYALLGVANGNLVWVPKFKTTKFSANWDETIIYNDPNWGTMLHLSKMEIISPGIPIVEFDNVELNFPVVENVAVKDRALGLFYLEVLDFDKKIFLIGFK